jgi:hypothetical protein
VDTLAVDIGAPGAVVEQQRVTNDTKAWKRYAGTYTAPRLAKRLPGSPVVFFGTR